MSSIMNPELDLAKDHLWKFQLRREHAQLLKEIDTHQDAFTSFADDSKAAQESLKEQLVGLKSRFEKLADDSQKQAQDAKEHWRAIETKVAEMDNIKAELKVLGIHINNTEVNRSIGVQPTPPTLIPTPQVHGASVSKTSTTSLICPSAHTNTTFFAPKPAHDKPNAGPRKSRRQARQEPSPLVPRTYARLPDPPITQGSASLTNYFLAANAVCSSIDPAHQTSLAAMFITGLTEREDQDAVVGDLEKKEMCLVRDDGQVEMKCSWEDLKVVLKSVGLLRLPSHKKGKK